MLTVLESMLQKLFLASVDNTGEPLKKIWNTYDFAFQVGSHLLLLSIYNNHSYPNSLVRFYLFILEMNVDDNLHKV